MGSEDIWLDHYVFSCTLRAEDCSFSFVLAAVRIFFTDASFYCTRGWTGAADSPAACYWLFSISESFLYWANKECSITMPCLPKLFLSSLRHCFENVWYENWARVVQHFPATIADSSLKGKKTKIDSPIK